MINITDKSRCTGCTACHNICNQKAISMQFDDCGHIYPKVNPGLCTDCGLCEKVCPLLHEERIPKDENPDTLNVEAVYNKDAEVRKRSTSGGVFSLLAEYVISKGGIVCAVRFDEHFHIHHSFFESIDGIDPYRGSKYAQSDLGETFSEIKSYLRQRPVLFVGTPCQVAGLKSYLIKDYGNLYTCDFICMSISSGKMWDEYIKDYEKKHKVKRIFFKDKRIGWHKTEWRMLIEDDRGEQLMSGWDNPFFSSYLTHLSARPSCFRCAFRHCRHVSDITIADCWGIETVNPDFDDNKGCTTLILQSEKGESVFESIKGKANYIDYDIQDVRKYNRHIENQAYKPEDYDQFQLDYKKHGFKYASNRALKRMRGNGFMRFIKRQIKRMVK